MAKLSLQEQMLQAGLINKKQAKKSKKGAKKLAKEVKASVEAKRAEQIARDQALNKEQQAQRQQKEIQAQIKQLIASNQIEVKGEHKYNFKDANKIKSVYVDEITRKQLVSGLLVMAHFEETYAIIPAVVGRKISERDQSIVIENEVKEEIADEDDPYKDYVVPDDLMW